MTTEERVRRLERENRWMKLAGGGLLILLVVVLVGGAGQDEAKVLDEVRARKLIILGPSGNVRATIRCDSDVSILELRGGGKSGGIVKLKAISLTSTVRPLGAASIGLFGPKTSNKPNQNPAQQDASGGASGTGRLALNLWLSQVANLESAGLSICGSGGTEQVVLKHDERLGSRLRVGPEYRQGVEVRGNEQPNIEIRDESGKIRAVLGCATTVTKGADARRGVSESTLTLFGPDGAVVEQLPR